MSDRGAPLESHEESNDALLALRARDGQIDALTTLLERYRNPLIALGVQLTGDRDLALDLLQEASIKAMHHIAELADPGLFYGWMRGIVRHLALDRIRSRKRADARHELHAERRARHDDPDAPDPEAIYREVVDAILSLPDEYHVPLFCRFVEEASYADIALRAGRTRDSVRGLIYRGTKLLRGKLEHHLS